MLLDVWRHAPEYRDFIDGSLPIVAQHVRENRSHYAFIARERTAGPPRVREAIGHEIDLITRELSTDIARTGAAEQYSSTDIGLLSDLIVSFVVTMAERLVEDPDSEERTLAEARTQLRMLLVGALNWRSREPPGVTACPPGLAADLGYTHHSANPLHRLVRTGAGTRPAAGSSRTRCATSTTSSAG